MKSAKSRHAKCIQTMAVFRQARAGAGRAMEPERARATRASPHSIECELSTRRITSTATGGSTTQRLFGAFGVCDVT